MLPPGSSALSIAKGKQLCLKNDNTESFTVKGVFKNVPVQSFLQFDFVIPFSNYLLDNRDALDPGATSNQTWVLLDEKSSEEFSRKQNQGTDQQPCSRL